MPVISVLVFTATGVLHADETNLLDNAAFTELDANRQPFGYALSGGAAYRASLVDERRDAADGGVALTSGAAGTVSRSFPIDPREGRAFSFRFRGLPQDDFAVPDDALYLEVEFSGHGGQTAYDGKRKQLYPLILLARQDLGVNGNGKAGGAATWRDYVLNFYVPFAQVDRLRLTVGCLGGGSTATSSVTAPSPTLTRANNSREGFPPRRDGPPDTVHLATAGHAFLITDFRLTRLPEPLVGQASEPAAWLRPAASELLGFGGRWFYRKLPGETRAPAQFDHTNADRLLYRDGPAGGCETPFAGNMSATLHTGNQDLRGLLVQTDQLVVDNVTVRFEGGSLIIHTHGLPNHPTGRFPEEGPGNPNYIREQDDTFYLPLEPKINPNHLVTTPNNSNGALNMGPIGVAVNGVVFFNPFDAGSMDASNIMDRCCGHPNQDGQYHYHKYPVCLNSPWSDEGEGHSPLLGWTFDGIPVYGPYESANVMAKDITGAQALNAFNLHQDAQRGWHYHVTPGRFPYLVGGYWGQVDARNVHPPRGRGRGPGGLGPGGMGPGGDGPPPPPPDDLLPPWLRW